MEPRPRDRGSGERMRRGTGGKEEEEGDLGDSLENRSSRMPMRSQSSDMGDVVGLVKDMAKFLDRLQHENLSDDSEQVGVEALQQNNETILHISGTELNVFTHRVRSPFLPNKSPQLGGQPGPASHSPKSARSPTPPLSTSSSVSQLFLRLQLPHVHIHGGQQSCGGRRRVCI